MTFMSGSGVRYVLQRQDEGRHFGACWRRLERDLTKNLSKRSGR